MPVDEPWPQPTGPQPTRRQPYGPPPDRPQPARPQANRSQANRSQASRVPPSRPPATGAPPKPRPGLLAAPIALPEPGRPSPSPSPAPQRDFGDDPLGTGYIVPTFEASTPLADQSWETVLRDRRRDGFARTGLPAEHESNGGSPPPAGGGEPGGDPLDFPRFETRFRRPPEQ
jgi:hypothetical protein